MRSKFYLTFTWRFLAGNRFASIRLFTLSHRPIIFLSLLSCLLPLPIFGLYRLFFLPVLFLFDIFYFLFEGFHDGIHLSVVHKLVDICGFEKIQQLVLFVFHFCLRLCFCKSPGWLVGLLLLLKGFGLILHAEFVQLTQVFCIQSWGFGWLSPIVFVENIHHTLGDRTILFFHSLGLLTIKFGLLPDSPKLLFLLLAVLLNFLLADDLPKSKLLQPLFVPRNNGLSLCISIVCTFCWLDLDSLLERHEPQTIGRDNSRAEGLRPLGSIVIAWPAA